VSSFLFQDYVHHLMCICCKLNKKRLGVDADQTRKQGIEVMAFRATHVSHEPLDYFLQKRNDSPYLRVSDIVLRCNHDPKELFSRFIRLASNSKWSHSALISLVSDPSEGFHDTFLIEAMTTGIRVASWRHEVMPYEKFTVGIKRPCMEWYVETPHDIAKRNPRDGEDEHGVSYLRHVRGLAIDQINGLYNNKTVYEIAALYVERVAKRRLSKIPQVAEAADALATLFRTWDESDVAHHATVLRFICSGLIQYSFFEALRQQLIHDFSLPEHRDAARSNLTSLQRIIFREDPEGVVPDYIHRVQIGAMNIADPVPHDVLNLLKTALPADFNNSDHLTWRYIIREGAVWEINERVEDAPPQGKEEQLVLALLYPEHGDEKEKQHVPSH
jgi:hypothetical protein